MSEKPRILVVDDEESHRIMLRAVLKDEGYEVAEAADGTEAVRAVEQEPFDPQDLRGPSPHIRDDPGKVFALERPEHTLEHKIGLLFPAN